MRAELPRFALVVALLAALAGCGDGPSDAQRAWSARIDAALTEADKARAAGDQERAEGLLEAALAEVAPEPDAPVTVALSENLWFALGRVRIEAGRASDALDAADRGLLLREGPASATVFTASLHALRALALEALGRDGDAIGAWEAAQIVHTRLFERALAGKEARP